VERSYVLEVSSPGLDRVLKKDADFVRFCGQRVRLRLRRPSEGCRNFQGTLGGLDDGLVAVETGGGLLRFPLSDIEEARLDPEVGV
jgi:ribosome maturation factor RimP